MSNNKGDIIIYKAKGGKTVLEVNLREETVWLNAHQIAALFDRERSVIVKHINNIYKAGELKKNQPVQKLHKLQLTARYGICSFTIWA